jgi:hypothetical protein
VLERDADLRVSEKGIQQPHSARRWKYLRAFTGIYGQDKKASGSKCGLADCGDKCGLTDCGSCCAESTIGTSSATATRGTAQAVAAYKNSENDDMVITERDRST